MNVEKYNIDIKRISDIYWQLYSILTRDKNRLEINYKLSYINFKKFGISEKQFWYSSNWHFNEINIKVTKKDNPIEVINSIYNEILNNYKENEFIIFPMGIDPHYGTKFRKEIIKDYISVENFLNNKII